LELLESHGLRCAIVYQRRAALLLPGRRTKEAAHRADGQERGRKADETRKRMQLLMASTQLFEAKAELSEANAELSEALEEQKDGEDEWRNGRLHLSWHWRNWRRKTRPSPAGRRKFRV